LTSISVAFTVILPMKKLKWLFLVFASFLTLSIIGFTLWLLQLNSQIKESLEKRTFQQPTEYFSAPRLISVSPRHTKDSWIQNFQQESYRQRDSEQVLRNGDFQVLDQPSCLKKYFAELSPPNNLIECLAFRTQQTEDPFALFSAEQVAVFDDQGTWIDAFAKLDNHLRRASQLALNSRKVAQYISGKPILQVYFPLGEIPPQCLNSVLAIEDSKFLEHQGVSVTGILRAVLNNLTGGPRQGGSTITQQLVKNDYLTPEKTLKRKIIEFFMSILLEFHSSKDQIFESYLNVIYLGQSGPFQVVGFGAASEFYFEKSLAEANLSECALLAAVLNSPGLYNPFTKPENALKRRNLVLERMSQLGFIDDSEKKLAQESPLPRNRNRTISETAPYFFNLVAQELAKHGLSENSRQVFTTLNIEQQEAAQKSLQSGLSQLEMNHKKVQELKAKGFQLEGALIAVDLDRSWISAVVGGRSFRMTQFNRAIQGQRQIGSVFKPLVYLEYFEQFPEESLLSLVDDRKSTIKYEGQSWSPDNYGKKHFEDVPIYFALKNSLNSATVHLAMKAGLKNIQELSQKMGATSHLMPVPSMALGSFEMTVAEVAQIYSTLAKMGASQKLQALRAVKTSSSTWTFFDAAEPSSVVRPLSAAYVINGLQQAVDSGTAASVRKAGLNGNYAGKTGTTSDNKDAWFAGFSPEVLSVTWVGYDQPQSHGLTGASGALPIWIEFMRQMEAQSSWRDFSWPSETEIRAQELVEPDGKKVQMDLLFLK